MCIRRVWNVKPLDMDIAIYKKSEERFPFLKRLVLYGFGEPFIYSKILEKLRIARKRLPDSGEILISTNGSLINPEIASKIVKE
ncbi:MAG: hypothetical protein ACPL1Z_06795, partial [Candidatus Bathyarchaeales archaeon]